MPSDRRWNFDDMFHSFGDITTSGWLAAILDFRHEVASAMTTIHLHVSSKKISLLGIFSLVNPNAPGLYGRSKFSKMLRSVVSHQYIH